MLARSSGRLSGAVCDRGALELDEDPRERSLQLCPEPARGALSAKEVVAGDACDDRDRQRDCSRQHDRAVHLAGDEQQHERDDRKQEPADRREHERARRGKPSGVRRVAAAEEVAVLDDARGGRRKHLRRQVRGQVGLAPAPQPQAWQKRPIHQRLGRNASEPEPDQDDHLPTVELRHRFPHLLIVDELRKQPPEHHGEHRNYECEPDQRPPRWPQRGCGSSVVHGNARAHCRASGAFSPTHHAQRQPRSPLCRTIASSDCESGGLSGNAARLGSARPCCAYARRWDRTG